MLTQIQRLLDWLTKPRRELESTVIAASDNAARHDWFSEHYKYLRDQQHQGRQNLDKLLVTVAGTGLALSLTFVQFISNVCYIELLAVSWALLIASLIFTLSSMWLSTAMFEWAYTKWLEDYDRHVKDEVVKTQTTTKQQQPDYWASALDLLNFLSIATLITGFIILGVFSYMEMDHKRSSAKTAQGVAHDRQKKPESTAHSNSEGQGNQTSSSFSTATQTTAKDQTQIQIKEPESKMTNKNQTETRVIQTPTENRGIKPAPAPPPPKQLPPKPMTQDKTKSK